MKLPIAETFHSIQGEGTWAGTPMLFVRLAGCSVGRYTKSGLVALNAMDAQRVVDGKHSECETVDGQCFVCDTDYHKHEEMTPERVLSDLWENHVCVTGGEPFLHQGKGLEALISACQKKKVKVHIETSGTVLVERTTSWWAWITCSPKKGFLRDNLKTVDEWKFVIGPDYDEGKILETIGSSTVPVYIQPVNTVDAIERANLKLCQELQRKHPEWRISIQLHKFLGLQ